MLPTVLLCVLLSLPVASARTVPGVKGLSTAQLFPRDMDPQTRSVHRRIMSSWRSARSFEVAAGSRALNPIDFGADPTCSQDSSSAFSSLMQALLNMTVGKMSDGIADLGGATVDLAGGCYLLSEPLVIPQFYGNLHVTFGELRATPSFPAANSVVQVGSTPCKTPSGQGSCNENVGFHGVTIDGSHVAAACLTISATMGSVLDSSSAIFGFRETGIALDGGHEAMISDTWVAAYFWSDPLKERNNATGIAINGNDHYVSNTIVFSALVGVSLSGAANILQGVHTWNCATGNGGIGILNRMSQNRFQGCYLDYTDLVLQGESGSQLVTIAGGFFLGGAQIVFEAAPGVNSTVVQGVAVQGNQFYASGSPPFFANETLGTFADVIDFDVEGLIVAAGQPFNSPVSALTTAVISSDNPAPIPFNFAPTGTLVFPSIPVRSVDLRVACGGTCGGAGGVPVAAYSFPTGQAFDVFVGGLVTGGAVTYQVTATADQSRHTFNAPQ